ncbi:MAG: hypothetical protein HY319_24925 [Armatimonadetes bacterium]|nr:hypothetical protein [Armatimonadota bacterium]
MSIRYLVCFCALLLAGSVAASAESPGMTVTTPDGASQDFEQDSAALEFLEAALRRQEEGRFTLTIHPIAVSSEGPGSVVLDKKGSGVFFLAPSSTEERTVEGALAELRVVSARRRYHACCNALKNYATALEIWSTDHRDTYPRRLSELSSTYMKTTMTCPAGGTPYHYTTSGKAYEITCSGDHSALKIRKGRPAWTSREGLLKD